MAEVPNATPVAPAPAGVQDPAVARFQAMKAVLLEQRLLGTITADQMNDLVETALRRMVGGAVAEATPDEGGAGVAQFFRQQREEELEPWKRRRCWAQKQCANIDASAENPHLTLPARRRQFISEAETGPLSPIEVFLARYTLFAENTEREQCRMLGILQNMDEGDRLPLHNWLVFEDMEPMERDRYGPVMDTLTVPLFPVWGKPPGERLQALNKRILSEAMERRQASAAVGGGRPRDAGAAETLFRKDRTLFGGGYQAPVLGSDGSQVAVVDLSDLETFLGDLSRRVDELRQEERAVGSAVLGELRICLSKARTSGIRSQRADLHRLRSSINRSMPPTRTQEWRGRGGYRGGGGEGEQVFGGETASKN